MAAASAVGFGRALGVSADGLDAWWLAGGVVVGERGVLGGDGWGLPLMDALAVPFLVVASPFIACAIVMAGFIIGWTVMDWLLRLCRAWR